MTKTSAFEERIWRRYQEMKRCPMLIVKMAILPKPVYRFNETLIKIPRQFFANIERKILYFIRKKPKPKTSATFK